MTALPLIAFSISTIPLEDTDFRTFYDSALRWRTGAPLYETTARFPNLNPPSFAVLLAPLTAFSLRTAFVMWTGIGILCLTAALRHLRGDFVRDPTHAVWLAVALTFTVPAFPIWQEGQLTWLLLWLVTQAWAASTPWRAGAWLAVAIALKPPVALLALALPWRIWVTAGVLSASMSTLSVAVTGWPAWQDWLRQSEVVTWLGSPMIVSLWGLAARIESGWIAGPTLATLSPLSVAAVAGASVVLYWRATRLPGDRRWVAAGLWMLLVSPAGWIYYLPLLLVPAARSWPRSRLAWLAVVLWLVPVDLLAFLAAFPLGVVIGGSLYTVAAALAWLAWDNRKSAPVPQDAMERREQSVMVQG